MIRLKELPRGETPVNEYELKILINSYDLNVTKPKTIEVPIEPGIVARMNIKISPDRRSVVVLKKDFIGIVGSHTVQFQDLESTRKAFHKLEEEVLDNLF